MTQLVCPVMNIYLWTDCLSRCHGYALLLFNFFLSKSILNAPFLTCNLISYQYILHMFSPWLSGANSPAAVNWQHGFFTILNHHSAVSVARLANWQYKVPEELEATIYSLTLSFQLLFNTTDFTQLANWQHRPLQQRTLFEPQPTSEPPGTDL